MVMTAATASATETWGRFIGVKWPSPAEFTETSQSHSDTELGLGLEGRRGGN